MRLATLAPATLALALAILAAPARAQPTPVDVVWSSPAGTAVHAVAFSPDGSALASGATVADSLGTVDVWDVLDGSRLGHAEAHPAGPLGSARAVAFAPGGAALATGHGTVRCGPSGCAPSGAGVFTWSVPGLAPLAGRAGAPAVRGVATGPSALAAASADGAVRLLDAATLADQAATMGHDSAAVAVAVSPDGALVASVGADGRLRVWDAATGAARYDAEHGTAGAGGLPVSVAFSADGTRLATGGEGANPTVRVWDAATGAPVYEFAAEIYEFSGPGRAVVAFSPNGRYLLGGLTQEITYFPDNTTERLAGLWFWDLATGERAALYADASAPEADGVAAVALSAAHDHLVAYAIGGTVRVARVALSLSEPVLAGGAFTAVPTTLPQGDDYQAVAPADADGDGDLDLLVVRGAGRFPTEYAVELYRNDGPDGAGGVAFAEAPFPAAPYPAPTQGGMPFGETLSWADFDADGDLDALVATAYGTALYRNDAGTFADSGTPFAVYEEFGGGALGTAASAWADVDNDGDLDLALPQTTPGGPWPSADSTRVVLFANDGGVLAPTDAPFPLVGRDVQLVWGDVENDGDLDLLYVAPAYECDASPLGECLVVYENSGGTLAARPVGAPGFRGGAADFGDFDLDGDLDILLVASLDNPDGPPFLLDRALVLRNDGAAGAGVGPFVADTLQFPFTFDEYFQALTGGQWADYDSDGDVDVVVGADVNDYTGPNPDYGGVALVFSNDAAAGGGPPAFTLRAAVPATERSGTMTWADFDGDNDLDLLSTGARVENGTWVDFARLYRNDAPAANAAPAAPGGLAATATADGVALSWAPATDDATPAASLTYNLRVRAADGSDIVSPMSRPGGGRMLPEPGNVSLNTAWALAGLAPGAYTWSVQAVDNAFNGGPFADGGAFTVGAVASEPGVAGAALAVGVAPNPSAGAARVSVAPAAPGAVRVAVFDALGREVSVLHDGPLAAGAHALALDAARLPAGVYVVRATAAGVAASRTLTVAR